MTKPDSLHQRYMRLALDEAAKAASVGEIPVGAVVVRRGEVIGRGYNRREKNGDPTGHGEIAALREACESIGDWRLDGCDLYVTLEPCAMCAGAILNSRIARVFYGAADPKEGAICGITRLFDLPYPHRPDYEGGVLEDECRQLLAQFFAQRRARKEQPE